MTHRPPKLRTALIAVILSAVAIPGRATSQDSNILAPVDTVEQRLRYDDFQMVDRRGSRFQGDRTSRVALEFGNGSMLVAKWAPAPEDGDAFNNSPRYEVAAYEAQKLFLEPHEYVVPPTVVRAFDLDWYRQLDPDADPTFDDTRAVLVVLQYWLFNIAGDDFWHPDRLDTDSVYAANMGNFNAFTYIVRHSDQNQGNYLISQSSTGARVFSVDNGMAFESRISEQGAGWRRMHVDAIPRETAERLRAITREDVWDRLATVAQFRIEPDGSLTPVAPEPPIHEGRGIRRTETMIQFGLDDRELSGVWRRIQRLVERIDKGDLEIL